MLIKSARLSTITRPVLTAGGLAICAVLLTGCQQPQVVQQPPALTPPPVLSQPPETIDAPAGQPTAAQPLAAPGGQAGVDDPSNAVGDQTPLTMPAQPEPPAGATVLTLEDLEQFALMNNPSLARAGALVASARGRWVQVGLPPNFSWGYNGQQLGSGGRSEQHGLMLDGELVLGGKLRWNRAVVEQEIVRAEQNMFAQQQRVMTDVRVAFYEALLAQRNLDLVQQLLKIASEAQNTAQRLHSAGETSEVDLRQAEIEVYTQENNLNDAQKRHFAAWQTLRAVIGVPSLPPAVLSGDVESIPDAITWEETLDRLLSTSPEVGAAVANVERARAALIRARREPIPNFRLQTGVQQDNGIGGRTDGLVQALLPLPLINRNQGGIRQAEADLNVAQAAVQQVELDLQNRLAPVFERYAAAANRVRRFREKIMPAAERQLELVRRGYRAGELPFLNLLIAQQRYFSINQNYLQSLLDLRTAAAQIEGLLLSNSLSTDPASR